MKKRSTVFFELEAQSNFLKKIVSLDQLISLNNYTPSQSKLLQINKSKLKTPNNGISVEDLNFDPKKYGEEFNQSKYVTIKNKKSVNFETDRTHNRKSKSKIPFKKFTIKPKENLKRKSFLLNKIDEDNLDLEVFDNNLKTIMKNHINYQVRFN